ncbi:type IV-A pilus assembly ATPase PilB [Acidithiobacillus ferridurans]|uniref:type IV-A pilus assembly ATPase PilB n=1 Tax=Acidithiobacillus ferridurans TaxID=1232575 RepID=UPI001C06AA05|nr:type IV-A pilus assembly ATPase PilB [Acidithiobacillus ferridurans]MBU2731969.1 type IV-A pilus assembly ATPase PilB [Acidithiobacillus ferridurans]
MATNPEHISLTPVLRALVSNGLSDEARLQSLAADPARGKTPLLFYVVEKGAVPAAVLMAHLSARYNMPMLDLDAAVIDALLIRKLDKGLMTRYLVLPLSKHGDTLYLAMADPTDFKAVEDVKFNSGLQVMPVLVEADKLVKAVHAAVNSLQGGIDDVFVDKPHSEEDPEEFDLAQENDGSVEDAPVVRFVRQLLLDAIQREVSDIHLEPYEKDFRVRYRLDGVLQDALHPPVALRDGVTSRLKILCRLDISERRLPQDGRLRVRVPPSRVIDFRVSFLPTSFGETIVLRLLDPASSRVPIEQLGFLPEQRKAFEDAIHRPYGMILVTGPTGSGKTTTLYTALNILNTGDCNISTAEDPVEIPVYGINQVNINERIGLTFAAALRSFLRQDPDIIMVGEVRDLETAETAIKAAQTGHLVLATLHTNDAPQSLTRLDNMGIPTYNIAGSVHLVMAQRLVRKLCPHCKKPLRIPERALIEAGFAPEDLPGWRPLGAVGCEQCNKTGYKGRMGLYQVMPVSDAMREIIMRGGTSIDLARAAAQEGVLTMRQNGLRRIREGVTSLEEVLRVTNL